MSLSKVSKERLSSCSEPLRELVEVVSRYYPIMVVEGHRPKERQDEAFDKGFSKVKWPDSKHNSYPSLAVDIAPLIDGKIDWNNKKQWYHMVGFVEGVAAMLGIKVRSGADWDMDRNVSDQSFIDLPHFELVEE